MDKNIENHWYKKAVIYTLDVKSFKDGDGDGLGDFKGLLENFDYLVDLGVNCVWLLPFFESRGKDFGYDVTNYFAVDPALGTIDDFQAVIEKAEENNIKIIIDLIVNHTSNEHPWFLEAEKDKSSKYRDYYVWSEEKPVDHDENVIFKNVESSNWEYSEKAGEYYYHTFYSFQPDLNISNPKVREEIAKVVEFWMKKGISGFRVDAVPHIVGKDAPDEAGKAALEMLQELKKIVLDINEEGVLLGEADVDPEGYAKYFENDKFDGLFNFYCNNFIYYSLAAQNPSTLVDAFNRLPEISDTNFYVNFLRNHDELDLERLTEEQRQKVFERFAPEENMRVYDRGIRRRLPPMVGNDRRILELCYSLLFSLPGVPMLFYGEEIGMGDDLRLQERESVRTAMQWSAEKNGGFTVDEPSGKVRTMISGGEFGYEKLNVEDQLKEENSLLHYIKRLIRLRFESAAVCYGRFNALAVDNKKVMGHICREDGGFIFALHNFSDEKAEVRFRYDELKNIDVEMKFGCCEFRKNENHIDVILPPYGYGWWSSK